LATGWRSPACCSRATDESFDDVLAGQADPVGRGQENDSPGHDFPTRRPIMPVPNVEADVAQPESARADLLARAYLDILARKEGVHAKSMLRMGS